MVGGVRAEETVKYNISLSSSSFKAFWISLIPTYNSGIEQNFNYTKQFGGKKRVGGVAYKCGKIAFVSSNLFFYFGMNA